MNQEAVKCFSQLLDLAPNTGFGHLGLGTKALQEGRYKDAVKDLAQGLFATTKNQSVMFLVYRTL